MDVQAQMNLPPPPPPSNLESAMCWPKHDLSTSGIEKVLDPNIHVYKEPIPPCLPDPCFPTYPPCNVNKPQQPGNPVMEGTKWCSRANEPAEKVLRLQFK